MLLILKNLIFLNKNPFIKFHLVIRKCVLKEKSKGGMNFIWAFIWNWKVLCTNVSLSLKLPTKDSLTDNGKSTS